MGARIYIPGQVCPLFFCLLFHEVVHLEEGLTIITIPIIQIRRAIGPGRVRSRRGWCVGVVPKLPFTGDKIDVVYLPCTPRPGTRPPGRCLPNRSFTSRRFPSGPQILADAPSVFATCATRLFKLSFWVYKNGCFVEAKRSFCRFTCSSHRLVALTLQT